MGFNLVGNLITQSGTDTDLSDLVGNGATTTTETVGSTVITTYNLGDNSLLITGTLSHNPETEILVVDNTEAMSGVGTAAIGIDSGGVYNYGARVGPSGNPTSTRDEVDDRLPDATGTRLTRGCGLRLTGANNGFTNADGSLSGAWNIIVDQGGDFNWIGGTISSAGSIVFRNGSNTTRANVNITDGILEFTGGSAILRMENCGAGTDRGLRVNGLRKTGGFAYIRRGVPIQFDGFVPEDSNNSQGTNDSSRNPYGLLFYGLQSQLSSVAIDADPIIVNNFSGTANVQDLGLIDAAYGLVQNAPDPFAPTVGSWLDGNGRSQGRVEFRKRFNVTLTDLQDGSNPDGVNLFLRDVRGISESQARDDQTPSGQDDALNYVYTGTSNSSGIATLNPITRIATAVSGVFIEDRRTPSDNTFTATVLDYNYNVQTIDLNVLGSGDSNVSSGISQNTLLTADEATAAGYDTSLFTISVTGATLDPATGTVSGASGTITVNTNATLDQLYDYYSWWLTRTVSTGSDIANFENGLRMTASGSTLGVGDFTLVLNAGLSAGTTFTTLDANNRLFSGLRAGSSGTGLDDVTIINLAEGQSFSGINTDLVLSSFGTSSYNLRGAYLNSTFRGAFTIFFTSDKSYSGINFDGNLRVAAFDGDDLDLPLTNSTFGENFSVTNLLPGASVEVMPMGTTDIDTVVGSSTARALFTAAGFTVVDPATQITVEGASGKYVLINLNDNSIGDATPYIAGQPFTLPSGASEYDVYIKPTTDVSTSSYYELIALTGVASSGDNRSVTPSALSSLVVGTLGESSNEPSIDSDSRTGSLATISTTATGDVTLTQQEAKTFLLKLTDTDSYIEAAALAYQAGIITSDPISPGPRTTDVNITHVSLNGSGGRVTLENTNQIGTGTLANTASVSVATFETTRDQAGISEGQVQNALNNSNMSTQVNSMASDRLLGIRPGTHLT